MSFKKVYPILSALVIFTVQKLKEALSRVKTRARASVKYNLKSYMLGA